MKNSKRIFGDQLGDSGIWGSLKFVKRKLPTEIEARQKQRLFSEIDNGIFLKDTRSKSLWSSKKIWYSAASIVFFLSLTAFLIWDRNVIATSFGEIATVELPDGTSVTLNGHSSISYSFVKWRFFDNRSVSLEGEAFFDVAKKVVDGNKIKFEVVTDNLQIEVLGTQFLVVNRSELEEVVLKEGKVQILIPDAKIPLEMFPGNYVGFNALTRIVAQKAVDVEQYTSWKDKYILLDNKTLGDLAEIITSVYGKKVVFENEGDKNIELEGKIPSDEIKVLVSALQLATKLKIRLQGEVVFIEDSSPKNAT